jgi:cell surface protein SprA
MRSEYHLNDENFIGFTGIILSEKILEQRVRIGQEPTKNFVWDVNTRFNIEPSIITKVIDFLPFIDTNVPSKLLFEGELGQVLPNPNTINIGGTSDINGSADLDNFEGSSMFTTIPIMRKNWFMSAIPFFEGQLDIANPAKQFRADKRRKLIWYSPWQQVPIKDIFPNKDVNTRTGTMTNILVLKRIEDKNHPVCNTRRQEVFNASINVLDKTYTFLAHPKSQDLTKQQLIPIILDALRYGLPLRTQENQEAS